LITRAKNSLVKKDLQRSESLRKEMENCTFQPQISNLTSLFIIKLIDFFNSSPQKTRESVFQKLHEDSIRKHMKFSFTQKKIMTESQKKPSETSNFNSFLDRQQAFNMKKEAKKE